MTDACGPIRVLATHPPLVNDDGKEVTISLETDRNGTIQAIFSREVLSEFAVQLVQTGQQLGGSSRTTMVPRRITVIKDHRSPDTFLQMEINDATSYIVPIGPQLLSTLIDGLDRARRVIPPGSTRQ